MSRTPFPIAQRVEDDTRQHATTVRAKVARAAKPKEIATVMVLNPSTLGALQAAVTLGATLTCELSGSTLTIKAVTP